MKKFLLSFLMLLAVVPLWAYDFEVDGIYYKYLFGKETVAVTFKTFTGPEEYTGKVTIPSSVDYEGITYSVTSIGGAAFYKCTGLTEVTIGNSVTSIGSDAFSGCTGLKELIIEGGESIITIDCKFNDSPIEKLHIGRNGTYAFNNRVDLKEVSIGDNVTSIPENAFNGCSNIATLKLGNKLETIGSGAFTGCATLMNVYSANPIPPVGAVFENKTYLNGKLYVVKGSKEAYAAADGWKEFINVEFIESSMIEDIDVENATGNISITTVNGEIIVKGAEDAQIAVYNINGGLIYQGKNRPIAIANKGVYIVVVNGVAVKVIL